MRRIMYPHSSFSLYPSRRSGSADRQGDHSAPRSGWIPQSWAADAGNAHTHGYGATSIIGTTPIIQVNDIDMHAKLRKAYMEDKENQEGGGGTFEKKAVRFSGMATVHYTEGRSTDAAADPGPRPPTSDPVPYTGGDVRRVAAQEEAAVAARADRAKWERANGLWWRSNNEWSSRSSNQ